MTHDEDALRSREAYQALTVLPGAWTIVRVDGRAFTRLTGQRFTQPYDQAYADLMVTTAEALLNDLGGRYAHTQGGEISVLLDQGHALFGRGVEKLVSVSAGVASATFTHAAGTPAHFESRLWIGTGAADVADYFAWRQSDATRNALHRWAYATLVEDGHDEYSAVGQLSGMSDADKYRLLRAYGVDFDGLPAWQRRGIGLWWGSERHAGFAPDREVDVEAARRRVVVERDLPDAAGYRAMIDRLTGAPRPASIGAAEARVGDLVTNGSGAPDFGPADLGPADLGPSGLGPSGSDADGGRPAGSGPSGYGPVGLGPSGGWPAGVPSGLGPSGGWPAGVGPSGLGPSGGRTTGGRAGDARPAGVGGS